MNRRAFTLIELMVVVSIVALLVAILLPALKAARETARSLQCLSVQRQLGMAYETHLNTQNRRMLAPTAGGNIWTWYLSNEYPDAILHSKAIGADISKSLLICPADTDAYGAPSPNDYPNYKIERGGSYKLNMDAYSLGPTGWTNMGGARAAYDPKLDSSWYGERDVIIKTPSKHVFVWDNEGPRTYTATNWSYRFDRSDYLAKLPDEQRHRGAGNMVYLDGHANSLAPKDIASATVTWTNTAYP